MMGVTGRIAVAALVAGVLSIDRSAFGQFQVSRPLVAAPLLGIVLGCPAEGAVIGLLYELLFLRSLPVGSFIPNHPMFPSLVTVLLVGTYQGPLSGSSLIGAAVLFALPTFILDRMVDIHWRRSNERSFYHADAYLRLGRETLAEAVHVLAMLRAGLFHGGSFLLAGVVLVPLFGAVIGNFRNLPGLLTVVAVTPFFTGLAGLASDKSERRGWKGLAAGLAAGVGAGFWWAVT